MADSSMVDASIFDAIDDSGDNYSSPAPVAKSKPAVKKSATAAKANTKAKAAPKTTAKTTSKAAPKTQTKPKATTSKKRPKPDSDDEGSLMDSIAGGGSSLANTPPSAKKLKKGPGAKKGGGKPLSNIENEGMGLDGAQDARSKNDPTYEKLTQLEHILKRPDTYIGSVELTEMKMWTFNSETKTMELRDVKIVPGLYKIFDEILVNAADNKQNDPKMDTIKVTVDIEQGEISVYNNGKGIPIEIHKKEKIYIPEMIFGHLLTSSNYNDDQKKVTGGRNGYGAKLCNVFSTQFTIETATKDKQKYKQTWTQNMSKMGPAAISSHKGESYTKVTFRPDWSKFGMLHIDSDLESVIKRRVYDMAGALKGVKVQLNGERLPIRNFKQYMEMYVKAIDQERVGVDTTDPAKNTIISEVGGDHDRWEVGFAVSDGSFQQVSFVNSIATTSGGTHVNYIADQIIKDLATYFSKGKNKSAAQLKANQIRNHLFIFVNCQIENPAFSSQTKEQLTTRAGQFGSKYEVSTEFIKKILKTEVVKNIQHFAQQKADQMIQKGEGGRRKRMDNVKLEDANWAGTKQGYKCTLILTEGDSAKSLAVAGFDVVGRDEFGVFPLRGKPLNVRDAGAEAIAKNAEIQNIKKFLGLQHKKVYTDTRELRYGHLMIMTDQDHDGSHIKGLLINFLEAQFPSLLKIDGFLQEFITPIVRVWKGDQKNPTKQKMFFTMPEYESWRENNTERGWEHKYYKGLGTSDTEMAQVYFRDLDTHKKVFQTMKDDDKDLIELAFSKKKADARKEWLRQFKPGTFLDHSQLSKGRLISYDEFINQELILFSIADNLRSIPSVMDGLKPGQRKVLFTCLKRNIKKDLKVVELGGLVSGMTAYHHGEQSMQQTIIGLAQNFTGSNNINFLEPSGNFGSRLQGGGDAASPRYIYTRLSPFGRKLFSPLDEPLLKYNEDDGKMIEPEVYYPIIPTLLVNGAEGIGTGWSTSIPNYNPEDIVDNLRRLMKDEEMVPMKPWFRGWVGEVEQTAPDRFKFKGIIKQVKEKEVEVTELPIRLWTQDFKSRLEDIIKAEKVPSFIKDYSDYSSHRTIHFIIQLEEKGMKAALEEGLEEKFKLSKTLATSNMVAFDSEGRIHRYETVEDIMREFYINRLMMYSKRKEHQLAEMQKQLERLTNQARFVKMIIDGDLVVSKKKKAVLCNELKQLKFTPFPKVKDAKEAGELERVLEVDPEEDEDADASAYDYLLGMAIWSLTQERVEKLLHQIGDKETEIDTLIKLSPKDLWSNDLDEFIAEWRFQLEDDANRLAKNRKINRRVSSKLGVKGPAARKRKAQGDDPEDSDFAVSRPKKVQSITQKLQPKKPNEFFTALTSQQPKPNGVKPVSTVSKPVSKPASKPVSKSNAMRLDGASDPLSDSEDLPLVPKPKQAVGSKASKKPAAEESDSDGPIAAKPPARQARAAAKKVVNYGTSSEDDSDNGDDMLGDVSRLVKGLDAAPKGTASRSLFTETAARPTSSAGVPKSKSRVVPLQDVSDDEFDLSKLPPPPPPLRRKQSNVVLLPDDSEDDSLGNLPAPKVTNVKKSAPKAPAAKPAKKTQPKKAAPAAVAVKQSALSPAAKAYAAKQAKARAKPVPVDSEDDVEALANDLLDSEEDSIMADAPPPPKATTSKATTSKVPPSRAPRRAAAAKPKAKYAISSSEPEQSEEESSEEDYDESE